MTRDKLMHERTMCDIGLSDEQWRQAHPEASQTMFFWADRLLQLQDELESVDLEQKRLKNLIDNAEQTLFDLMVNGQVEQFKRQGYSFSPTIKTRVSIVAKHKEEAYEWLKNSEFSDLVKETVNAQTLTSLVKEWTENGVSDDVAPFYSMLNVYEDQKISIKKGK